MSKPWIRIDFPEVSTTDQIFVSYTRTAGVMLGENRTFITIVLKLLYPELSNSDLAVAKETKFFVESKLTIFIGYFYLIEDDEVRLGISVSKKRKDQFCKETTINFFKHDGDKEHWKISGGTAINLTKVLQELSSRLSWEQAVLGSDNPKEREKKLYIPYQIENIDEDTFMLSVPVCGVSAEHYEQHYLKIRRKAPKTA